MITTLKKTKEVLGITGVESDLQIISLIPQVQADYLHIRNKPFDTGRVLTVTAGATTAGDITVTANDTEYTIAVKAGESAVVVAQRIAGNIGNTEVIDNKVRFIGEIFALTFSGGTTGATATVSDMGNLYPVNAEMTAINMINYHLQAQDGIGKASESLGDYSVTYDRGFNQYPQNVIGSITRYAVIT